jgi:hypothetical protein
MPVMQVAWNAKDVRKYSRLEEQVRDDLELYLDKVGCGGVWRGVEGCGGAG